MSNTTLAHAPTPTDDQIDRILDAMADAFVHQLRSPIMHTPSEQNRRTKTPRFPRSTACRSRVGSSQPMAQRNSS
jgi:hypothetical protein